MYKNVREKFQCTVTGLAIICAANICSVSSACADVVHRGGLYSLITEMKQPNGGTITFVGAPCFTLVEAQKALKEEMAEAINKSSKVRIQPFTLAEWNNLKPYDRSFHPGHTSGTVRAKDFEY